MYANGRIPLAILQRFDDDSDHYLPAGTAARWLWLVRTAKEKYGATLRVTPGPNAYRWYEAQIDALNEACASGNCNDAATPGLSSHGGVYDGRECMAIDVYNWGDLADDDSQAWGRFVALCRLAGFTTLLFDWERWHIVDFNDPWTVPDWVQPTPTTPSEEDDMLMLNIITPTGTHKAALSDGVFRHFVPTDPYEWIKNVERSDDAWVDVRIEHLPALLRTHGCDLNIWDIRAGQFYVVNPLDGSVKPGNAWTAVNARHAEQMKFLQDALGKA